MALPDGAALNDANDRADEVSKPPKAVPAFASSNVSAGRKSGSSKTAPRSLNDPALSSPADAWSPEASDVAVVEGFSGDIEPGGGR